MMHFQAGLADGELLAELKDAGVLTPDVIERIDAQLGHPETGSLNEFLLAGAALIPSGEWLSWLIRQHGCHRFGRVTWHEEAAAWLPAGILPEGNLAYRPTADGRPMIALLRPDFRAATAERFRSPSPVWAAATLSEIGALRSVWAHRVGRRQTRPRLLDRRDPSCLEPFSSPAAVR